MSLYWPDSRRSWTALLAFLAAALAVGQLGGLVTAPAVREWYPTLDLPSWRPPDAAFPIVWTILYIAMAYAAWLVWQAAEMSGRGWEAAWLALSLYGIQLALNLAWSYLFFGLRSPGLGLLDVFPLAAVILAALIAFKEHSRLAAWLMAPYLAWVCFAAVLNFEIWARN